MMQPDGIIRSAADAERVGRAGQALVHVLCADDRVLARYQYWRLSGGRAPDLLLAFDRLLCGELGLPYRWLPRLIAAQFAAVWMAVQHDGPLDQALIRIQPGDEMRQLPPGRGAKTTEDHIARDVEWFYQHRLQPKPTSIRALAKAYQQTVDHPLSDPRPTIRAGITRAERLLAAIVDA
jgi:hypothetical protein